MSFHKLFFLKCINVGHQNLSNLLLFFKKLMLSLTLLAMCVMSKANSIMCIKLFGQFYVLKIKKEGCG